jgi:hypothetical protein
MVWPASAASEITSFFAAFTAIAPKIHFNPETSDERAEFLDLYIFKGARFNLSALLDIKVHQKALNRYLYIPYSSYHPSSLKRSFIKTELIRYARNCSSKQDFLVIQEKFFERLVARGYPKKQLRAWFQQVDYNQRQALLDGNSKGSTDDPMLTCVVSHNPAVDKLKLRRALDRVGEALHRHFPRTFKHSHLIIARKSSPNILSSIRGFYRRFESGSYRNPNLPEDRT